MLNDFAAWLAHHGLKEIFTTNAGDSLYVNKEQGFGVIRKKGEYGTHSFYLDDIVGFQTYDDENLIINWSCTSSWTVSQRSTRYSTNEVFMKIRFKDQTILKLQIFHGIHGNITRNTSEHINLLNYACRISQVILNCATGGQV